jgi:hypothetical protein
MINVYFKHGAVSQFTRRFHCVCNVYVSSCEYTGT